MRKGQFTTVDGDKKRCASCEKWLTFDNFSPETRGCGLKSYCRECMKAKKKAKKLAEGYKVNLRFVNEEGVEVKKCTVCGMIKPTNDYYWHGGKIAGDCKECNYHKRQAAYKADPEKFRKKARDWGNKNSEKRKQKLLEWRAKNPDKRREYYNRTRENNFARVHEYRARIRNAPRIEGFTREEIIMRDGYICHICGGFVLPEELHIDHVIPLSRGGPHTRDNAAVAHRHCNLSKGGRWSGSTRPTSNL